MSNACTGAISLFAHPGMGCHTLTFLSIHCIGNDCLGKNHCMQPARDQQHHLHRAAGKHVHTQQSRQSIRVPFTSFSAYSDTITSLYRVLFHLSLMVLVCCWSQTQILLCMNFTTCFTHYSQGTRLFEDTPCTESCRRHIGFSPLSMLFSRGVLLHLNW